MLHEFDHGHSSRKTRNSCYLKESKDPRGMSSIIVVETAKPLNRQAP